MSLSEHDVRHVAMLARLGLTDEETKAMQSDLNSILGHIDEIQRLDLAGVEPMAHAIEVVNVTRPDVARPSFPQAVAISNAPLAENGAFVIPQITGGGDDE
ncbi:MAG: Asp-tRNA(Asn)/Glu-tRNA(Gln) amidotransferase subunit GatC [Coriobacteriia bacterium]|nr:Asp-tRNA(Asn)/Glu-tRNA(Gln) amidotransferase subunit GatC [Coriobacteriia bacterium]